jgi:hypothetical protein
MTIHKRPRGGLGWNYAGFAITLILAIGALALVASGGAEIHLASWALVRLGVGIAIFAAVLRAATRRYR